MPFTYRDKPRLSERLRGKSGEEILNELKSDLDKDRRMFFDSPSWGTRKNISAFPRGFPFDDEDRGRTDFKSYFDNLATRHPEFATHLKDPDWCDEFGTSFGRKRAFSGSRGEEENQNQASGSSDPANQQQEEEPRQQQQNLNQFGLRNTVPLAQNTNSEEERKQRSMSAPPDNRTSEKPKRYVTKCEIPMHDPTQDQTGKPPMAPKTSNTSNEQAQKPNQPNVRVIPIQVEGRDEPVINTNIDTSANFAGETFRDPVFEGRLPRDFGAYRQHSPRFAKRERMSPQPSQQRMSPQPSQQQQHPHPHPQTQAHPQPQQTQVPHPPQQQPSTDEIDSRPKQQPSKPELLKDPLTKVQFIQKEVEELAKQVEAFEGTSRKDKQYMILDELLTRKLISLDDIDTEGKENVRQARKDTIRSIQRCISMLESKVPVAENLESNGNDENNEEMKIEDGTIVQQPMEVDSKTSIEVDQNKQMEVDQTKNDAPEEPLAKKEKIDEKEESKEEQTMEVESDKNAQEQCDEVK